VLKSYNYSKHQSGEFIYLEITADRDEMVIDLVVKSGNDELGAFYSRYVEGVLLKLGVI